MKIRKEFEKLCNLAYDADMRAGFSVTEYEEYLEQLLLLCQRNLSEYRQEIVECFILVGKSHIKAPYDTVAFCMHTLRLIEVLKALKIYSRSVDLSLHSPINYRRYFEQIEESYEATWEDRDMWRIYDRVD